MFPEKSHEFRLIDRFRAKSGPSVSRHPQVLLGIGDDAAIVRWSDNVGVLAADLLLEGVHFDLARSPARDVGRKSVAVNLSDVAAMASVPRFVLVSLGLPRSAPSELADELYAGMESVASEFDTVIVGGDTTSWDGPLVINVAIAGESGGHPPVTRGGARPGDWLFVTGELGGSLSGRHLTFTPRVREALLLRDHVDIHAMLDVSDGLVADLYHMLEESSVGAELLAGNIPCSDAARSMASQVAARSSAGEPPPLTDTTSAVPELSGTPLLHALSDGEDFELLFAVSPEHGRRLLERAPFETRLTHIGTITADAACRLIQHDGRACDLPRLGWSHPVDVHEQT